MVTLGTRLRMLAQHRIGVSVSVVLACLAALSTVIHLRLLPPGLIRVHHPGGAHAQILVDDVKVSVLADGFDYKSFGDLHQGALLAASVMVRDPASRYIAHDAGIPWSAIAFDDPQTPIDPPLPASKTAPAYSLTVATRPTVPIIDVYAQAPTEAAALRMANASASGLSRYLDGPGGFGLRVSQMGDGAQVSTATSGTLKPAIQRFLEVLVLGCAITLLIDRARRNRATTRPRAQVAS
jgi:hypothetical protein